jgi:DNA-binding MarR family transcriptional regulator
VTAPGNAALRKVLDAARAVVADRLADLAPRERALVARAMARVSAAAAPRGHAAPAHGR